MSMLLGVTGSEDPPEETGDTGVDGRSCCEIDDDGDSYAHVAPQDEKSVHGAPNDESSAIELTEFLAKTISEFESLLQ